MEVVIYCTGEEFEQVNKCLKDNVLINVKQVKEPKKTSFSSNVDSRKKFILNLFIMTESRSTAKLYNFARRKGWALSRKAFVQYLDMLYIDGSLDKIKTLSEKGGFVLMWELKK